MVCASRSQFLIPESDPGTAWAGEPMRCWLRNGMLFGCAPNARDCRIRAGSSAHALLRRDVCNWRLGVGDFLYCEGTQHHRDLRMTMTVTNLSNVSQIEMGVGPGLAIGWCRELACEHSSLPCACLRSHSPSRVPPTLKRSVDRGMVNDITGFRTAREMPANF